MINSIYTILEELEFIIEYHEGLLTLESIIDYRMNQMHDPKFNPGFNMLLDMRNVEMTGDPEEVQEYVDFYMKNKNITGNRRVAVLTNTPKQVFYTTLFEQNNDKLMQKTKIFSTQAAALKWLNVNLTEPELNKILHGLSTGISVIEKSR